MKRILIGVLTLLLTTTHLPSLFPTEIAKPTVDLSIYGHVGWVMWVVRDLDPVLNYWEKLGLKITRRPETREIAGLVYRSKPSPTKAKAAFTQIGGVTLEWLQPVSGTNLYTEFLGRHGDGILALGYAVKSEDELAAQVEYFRSRGVELLQSTEWKATQGTGHRAYLDTAGNGGGQTIALYYDPDGPAPAAGDSERNGEPFNRIVQYAFVVHDVEKPGATGKAWVSAACRWNTISASTAPIATSRENSKWIWAGADLGTWYSSGSNPPRGPMFMKNTSTITAKGSTTWRSMYPIWTLR